MGRQPAAGQELGPIGPPPANGALPPAHVQPPGHGL